jgi:hypothetical protein
MSSSRWLWPVVIVASAALAASGAHWPQPARALVMLWFLAVCPGMALVRLLDLADDRCGAWTFAIASSLCLQTITATIMVYGRAWSPIWAFNIAVAVAVGAVAIDVVRRATSPRRQAGPSAGPDDGPKGSSTVRTA